MCRKPLIRTDYSATDFASGGVGPAPGGELRIRSPGSIRPGGGDLGGVDSSPCQSSNLPITPRNSVPLKVWLRFSAGRGGTAFAWRVPRVAPKTCIVRPPLMPGDLGDRHRQHCRGHRSRGPAGSLNELGQQAGGASASAPGRHSRRPGRGVKVKEQAVECVVVARHRALGEAVPELELLVEVVPAEFRRPEARKRAPIWQLASDG